MQHIDFYVDEDDGVICRHCGDKVKSGVMNLVNHTQDCQETIDFHIAKLDDMLRRFNEYAKDNE